MTDNDPIQDAPVQDVPQAPAPGSARDEIDELIALYSDDVAPEGANVQAGNRLLTAQDATPGEHRLTDPLDLPESEMTLEALRTIKDHNAQQLAARDQRDGQVAIEAVRGEASQFSDAMVRGWLHEQAARDEKVAAAWANRYADPQSYQRAVTNLSIKFQKEHGNAQVDAGATEDRELVALAVRGKETLPAQENNSSYRKRLARMSDGEFESYRRDLMNNA